MNYTWRKFQDKFVLYEDDAVLALNKPAGISVVGDRNETDLITLAQEEGKNLFPAHRIDKETSGAILFARTSQAHASLTRQFNHRTIEKAYLAITRAHGLPEQGTIDLPLSVGRKKRVRVAAKRTGIIVNKEKNYWSIVPSDVFDTKTYPSITVFAKVWEDKEHTLLVVTPITGRRHQIRIHFAWIGHPIAGDPLFEKDRTTYAGRMLLHSWRIGFDANWSTDNRIELEAVPGEDFWDT